MNDNVHGLHAEQSVSYNGAIETLKVVSWNIEGLAARIVEPGFLDYLSTFDICFLQETFTGPDFDFDCKFENYLVFHCPAIKLSRQGRRSGGVLVLVKNALAKYVSRIPCNHDNMVIIRLMQVTCKDIVMISAYIPPADSPYYNDRSVKNNLLLLEDVLVKTQDEFPMAALVILGDLNARTGCWNIHKDEETSDETEVIECGCANHLKLRRSCDQTVNRFGKILINLCEVYHLCILNGSVQGDIEGNFTCLTPNGESVVDYCLIAPENLTCPVNVKIAESVHSSHMPVEVSVGPQFRRQDFSRTRKETVSKLIWDNDKLEKVREQLQSPYFKETLAEARQSIERGPELALQIFENALQRSVQCMYKTVTNRPTPRSAALWYDTECQILKKEAKSALARYRSSQTTEDKDSYIHTRKCYKDTLRQKRRTYREAVCTELLSKSKDSKAFWSIVRRTTRKTVSLPNITLDTWADYFRKLFEHVGSGQSDFISGSEGNTVIIDEDLDATITEREVKWAIRKLRHGRAPGEDEIPSDFLKVAGDLIVPFLTDFFAHLYDRQIFPSKWGRSIIVPIFKAGDKLDPSNYRGISLLSVMSKLFLSILTERLKTWAEDHNKICFEQAGFRSEHSTIDHVFTLHSAIVKNVYGVGRGKLYAAFIDFKKAFDYVDRSCLWKVLLKFGVSTKLVNMFKAVYSHVCGCVKWNSMLSELFECPVGVRQGASESPTIFSLYISFAAEYIRERGLHGIQFLPNAKEIFLLLFADDVVLLSTTPVGLQNQITNLEYISKKLGLIVNTDKTKVMIFRKGGYLTGGEKWFLNGEQLESVNRYKYLGYMFSTKLSVSVALEYQTVRAKQKVMQLLKSMKSLSSLNTFVFFKLFDSQVTPALLYGAELWGHKNCDDIEKTHMFACKQFLSLDVRSPNTMIYGETGRYPLRVNAFLRALRYWFKILKMPIDRLPKQAYLMLINSNVPGELNWARGIENFLSRIGCSFIWANGGSSNESKVLNLIEQRLKDCFRQEWHVKLESNRFALYRRIKSSFELENYLNFINIKKFRDTFIRFRLGINELGCNRKRFVEYAEISCPFCSDQVENEEHFLLYCPKYSVPREKYIAKYVKTYYSYETLINGRDPFKTRDVSMYLFYAMQLRQVSLQEN